MYSAFIPLGFHLLAWERRFFYHCEEFLLEEIFSNFTIIQCSDLKITPHINGLLLVIQQLSVWTNVICHHFEEFLLGRIFYNFALRNRNTVNMLYTVLYSVLYSVSAQTKASYLILLAAVSVCAHLIQSSNSFRSMRAGSSFSILKADGRLYNCVMSTQWKDRTSGVSPSEDNLFILQAVRKRMGRAAFL